VKDLVIKYGDRIVLNDISTEVSPSEIRVVLGTSGCGKTTLLKTIIGLLKPFSGYVRLLGTDMSDPDAPETVDALKRVGVLFQNGALLGSLTVEENIALPLQMHTSMTPRLIHEIVMLKLAQVDLPHAAPLFPNELSGGMRKRAALARALALDPPVVLCDEPSAGLDPVTSAGLDELLLKLREALGITIVVVTHELFSIEKIADTITFLHNGVILYEGKLDNALQIKSGPVADFFNRHEQETDRGRVHSTVFNVESG
jgi:phospholipid/cholesterol/gamma-HCH transport system ATP-binding protein